MRAEYAQLSPQDAGRRAGVKDNARAAAAGPADQAETRVAGWIQPGRSIGAPK